MNTKTIKFDLNKYKLYEKIKAKQGDTKSRFLLFQLLDGSIPFNLTNRSVRAYMVKPDGKEIFNDLIINNYSLGYCTLELTNQILAVSGTVKIELMVTEEDKKLTSSVFELEVVKSINSEKSIVSTNEFTALLNGLASLSEYDNYKNSVKSMEINKADKAKVEEKFGEVYEQLDTIRNEELPNKMDNTKTDNLYAKAINESLIIPFGCLNAIKNAIKTGTIKVAIVGDSITEGADLGYKGNGYAQRFEKELKERLKGVNVTFKNFAISGQTLANFVKDDYIPTGREWCDEANNWYQHIIDFQPNLLIVSFGMNDGQIRAFEYLSNLNLLKTKVLDSISNCSYVLTTTILPTENKELYTQDQELTEYIAKLTYNFANSNGYACCNVNRLFCILRNGKDYYDYNMLKTFLPLNKSDWSGNQRIQSVNDTTFKFAESGTITYLNENGNFAYEGYISFPSASSVTNDCWLDFIFRGNAKFTNSYGFIVRLIPKTDGSLDVLLYNGTGTFTGAGKNITTLGFGKVAYVEISFINNKVIVKIKNEIVFEKEYVDYCFDGYFAIKNYSGGAIQFAETKIAYGKYLTEPTVYLESDLVGTTDKNTSGNGINHPTDFGHGLFYYPPFKKLIDELIR